MFDSFLYRILPSKKKYILLDKGKKGSGALPDIKDERDFKSPLMGTNIDTQTFPDSFNLEDHNLSKVEDQKSYNSCVSHAITTAVETYSLNNGWKHYFELSRMYHWYYGRKLSGTFPENSGMYIRDGWKIAQGNDGISIEKLAPYEVIDYNQEPGVLAKIFRKWHVPFTYYWIDTTSQEITDNAIKSVLVNKKVPIVFGLGLPASFYTNLSKDVYNPVNDDQITGYHAMLIIGYDKDKNAYLIRNSWSAVWCNMGNIWINKDWFLDHAYNLSYPDKVNA